MQFIVRNISAALNLKKILSAKKKEVILSKKDWKLLFILGNFLNLFKFH